MNQSYEQKYLKYKQKYLQLKAELEGGWPPMPSMPWGKSGPASPQMQKLQTKEKNINEKIAMFKQQISAQKRKDEADAAASKAQAALAKTQADAQAAKEARRAAKEQVAANAAVAASFSGGVLGIKLPTFGATSTIRPTDSDATKALKNQLKEQEDKLVEVQKEIAALREVESRAAVAAAAAAKQAKLAETAAAQKQARALAKQPAASTEQHDPVPTDSSAAAPAAYW
jgi:hypothetical protein